MLTDLDWTTGDRGAILSFTQIRSSDALSILVRRILVAPT